MSYDNLLKPLIASVSPRSFSTTPSLNLHLLAPLDHSAYELPYLRMFGSLLGMDTPPLASLPQSFVKAFTTKPKVFVSYHHAGDQEYYDEFRRVFANGYDVCHDNSVDRIFDTNDSSYVMRRIREQYLTGTSCTIVLCGAATPWRKFVDWEIKATLDKQHGLVGINLPTNRRDMLGRVHKPERLQDNIDTGFAVWLQWEDVIAGGPEYLQRWLQIARLSAPALIRNWRPLRKRNG